VGKGVEAKVEELLASVYGRIYNLAIRMLFSPEEAEDATQDIVVKVLRGLPGFRGDSSFATWSLAIAANHLRSLKSRALPGISFEAYEAEVGPHADPQSVGLTAGERLVLEKELKLSCTLGMLQCLDTLDRLVYVLNCFFGLSSEEGGRVAGLAPEAYRQRLSRARRRMADFLDKVCDLRGACSCSLRLGYALAAGRISKERPYLKRAEYAASRVDAFIGSMEELDAAAALFRAQPPMLPEATEERLKEILRELADGILA
jgi:RNA polymerase sigma factor (sigma-70 family)